MSRQNLSSADKERIKRSFSKAAHCYDEHAVLQRELAEELLRNIVLPLTAHHSPLTTILDIGCGTGFLTYSLAKIFRNAHIVGCDISHPMIEEARSKRKRVRNKKIHLLTADGELLPCKDETFHIVASNLTYQWLPDLKTAFLEANRILRPGGIFVFSTFGPRTFRELRSCYRAASAQFHRDGLPPFMYFSGEKALTSTLKDAGFTILSVKSDDTIRTYRDIWTLLKTIKSIGAGNPFKEGDKSLARGAFLKKMAEVYKQKFRVQSLEFRENNQQLLTTNSDPPQADPTPDCIYATYEVIFVYGKKQG